MMRMSPQTVGLITSCLVMTLLSTCMPTDIPHTHDQPSSVLQFLRRFWPFNNPTRPITEPLTAIKYFHTSPRHNSRFLYAKRRLYPDEPKFISRGDVGIHIIAPSVPRTKKINVNNEFPYPIHVSHITPTNNLNRPKNYAQRRYSDGTLAFPYSGGAQLGRPHRNPEDPMEFSHNTKYEEIDLPQSKILDTLKKYNPLSKLTRRIDLVSWNRENESREYLQSSPSIINGNINFRNEQLPPKNYRNHPDFDKHEVSKENTDALSRDTIWTPLNKPVKLFNEFPLSKVPDPNYGLESTFLGNLRKASTNSTLSGQLDPTDPLYSDLRWTSMCLSFRNVCIVQFGRDRDGNRCISKDGRANITEEFGTKLDHIVKGLGKPCNKTENTSISNNLNSPPDVSSNTESFPHNVNGSSVNIPRKHVMYYSKFTNIQRKGRMLKVIEEDLTSSTEQSVENSFPRALQNETTHQDNESLSFPPSITTSLVDRSDADYVSYEHSELDSFTETEIPIVQYSVSLLPNNSTLGLGSKVVPHITEKPKLGTFNTSETAQTRPLDISEGPSRTTISDYDDGESTSSENTGYLFHGNTPRILNLRLEERQRQGKMTEIHGTRGKSGDRSTNVFGRRYRAEDYDSEIIDSATSQNLPVFGPEFKPGSRSNFSITFRRQPVKHMSSSEVSGATKTASDGKPRRYYYDIRQKSIRDPTTEVPNVTEEVRVIGSTFFPNRVQKVSLHFGKKNMNSFSNGSKSEGTDKKNSLREEGETDDGENEMNVQEVGFTMEKLAYLLIGTCCCLSIICLIAVVAAIKCRRVLIERRLKNRLFRHNLYHSSSAPWQQHIYDPFLYINGRPPGSLSSRDSCNCKCVTWTLGARNLDTRPFCPTRSSVYLTGRKNLPFGAASTLCYETMIHTQRRKPTTRPRPPPRLPTKSEDSSNENDSLDPSSDADTSPSSEKRCTCIHSSSWATRAETSTAYNKRPDTKPKRKKSCGCPHNPENGTSMLNGDCPPPVRGSDYLDRSDGVVYWSSNDERLI